MAVELSPRLFLLLVVGAILRQYEAAVITDVQIGLSSRTELYCPNDTVVYTCETVVPTGPTVLAWDIPQQFANTLTFLIGQSPEVGDTLSDGVTGAVANLTVMEADRWVSTLTITNPGSRLTASTVSVTCVDTTTASQSLTAIVPLQYFDDTEQDCSEISGLTTQISWDNSSVAGAVTLYSSSSSNVDGVIVEDFETTGDPITASVTIPEFNVPYNVCIAATNECADPLTCVIVMITSEAPKLSMSILDASLTCGKPSLTVFLQWDLVAVNSNSCTIRDVNSTQIKCGTEDPMTIDNSLRNYSIDSTCLDGSNDIKLTVQNSIQSDTATAMIMDGSNRIICPPKLNISVGNTIFFFLNEACSMEDPVSTFEIIFVYSNKSQKVNGTTIGSRGRGFEVTVTDVVVGDRFAYTITLFFNGEQVELCEQENALITMKSTCPPEVCGPVVPAATYIVVIAPILHIIFHALLVFHWNYLYFLGWAGCCSPETKNRMHRGLAVIVFLFYLTPVTTIILICYMCYLCCCNSKGVSGDGEDSHLKEGTLSHEQELPTYQDPGEIKRQAAPDSHDVYTVPEKKPKKKKAQAARVEEISAEEAGPMYQDPDTINRQPAPESGQLYTVVEPTKKASSRRKPPVAPDKTEAELAEMYSTPDKSRQREGVNYTDLSLPGSSAPPSSQGGVQYSQVRM